MLTKIIIGTTAFFLFSLLLLWSFMRRFNRALAESQARRSPARIVADKQLVAYNGRDLEAFMALFAEDALLTDLPTGAVTASGKPAIRALYRDRFGNPDLACTVHQKTDLADHAIDRETVTGLPGGPIEAIAIYEVREGLIRSVRVIRQPG